MWGSLVLAKENVELLLPVFSLDHCGPYRFHERLVENLRLGSSPGPPRGNFSVVEARVPAGRIRQTYGN